MSWIVVELVTFYLQIGSLNFSALTSTQEHVVAVCVLDEDTSQTDVECIDASAEIEVTRFPAAYVQNSHAGLTCCHISGSGMSSTTSQRAWTGKRR
eukprot:362672-Chlamydomonas_euryale.AAC.9